MSKPVADFVLDIHRDPTQSTNLITWCTENLDPTDYEITVVKMIPCWHRFRFHCPKNKLMAVLAV
jgi:hypothetical protein